MGQETRTDVDHREGRTLSADGTNLYWQAWVPPSAPLALAVVHGHGEHSGRYARLAAAMVPFQVATFAIDLRGSGRSPGQRGHVDSWVQYVEDAASFLNLVQREFPGTVVPLGHSFGGVVMLSAVLSGAIRTSRFVVSSPALTPRVKVPALKIRLGQISSTLLPRLSLFDEVDPAWISRDPAVVSAYREDPLVHDRISARLYTEWVTASNQILASAHRIEIPFFAFHGAADPIMDPAGTEELCRRATVLRQLRIYSGRFHETLNDIDNQEVFDDLGKWLAS